MNQSTPTLLLVITAILPVAAAAIAGNLATIPNIPTWYAHLTKPSFNPPNWVFAPVWTTLFLMMAYAFYRVLVSGSSDWAPFAVALFLVQMALNPLWSWVFFSLHSPRAALAVIAALWLAILLTTIAFWQVDRIASLLLWPYLMWVSFAAVLNWEIDRLN